MSIVDQPAPIPNAERPSWELVIEDMHERHQIGVERYGTPLQPGNGRDSLVDAYQEVLDGAVYLRNEIEERRRLRDKLSAWSIGQISPVRLTPEELEIFAERIQHIVFGRS